VPTGPYRDAADDNDDKDDVVYNIVHTHTLRTELSFKYTLHIVMNLYVHDCLVTK
jgi:hypothetical protein